MRILFIHPNFPAQFRHIATALGRDSENEVIFATQNPRPEWEIPGVTKKIFEHASGENIKNPVLNPFVKTYKMGEAVFKLLLKLKKEGFTPDLIYGHSGWGSTWFIRDVFPAARFIGYFEWYYNQDGADVMFDRGKAITPASSARLRMKNAVILNDLLACDVGICPTKWQKAQFPESLQYKLTEIHDGIQTSFFRPFPDANLDIEGISLKGPEKIITYCARGMEPYRGFPQFMASLEIILEEDKTCHAVIAGSERVCYGPPLPDGKTYKEKMLETLSLDMSRIHFTGPLPYGSYLKLLQASSVHVYLTRPFVLSWSLLEALSSGCVVVGSDTEPVREVIEEGVNGFLVDFFSPDEIARKVLAILSYPSFMAEVRKKARDTIIKNYDLNHKLAAHLNLIKKLTKDEF
ncbi:MAG: glycosyltransferase [Proteobacteria bacterium]|nr:glycosyltransferase [Pseudomonadota bacterium]